MPRISSSPQSRRGGVPGAGVLCLAHSKMKLCLFASYTYKRKSIRVFRTPILVYLDVRGVEIPLLSTVSISNCRYQEAPGEVVWSAKTYRKGSILVFCRERLPIPRCIAKRLQTYSEKRIACANKRLRQRHIFPTDEKNRFHGEKKWSL